MRNAHSPTGQAETSISGATSCRHARGVSAPSNRTGLDLAAEKILYRSDSRFKRSDSGSHFEHSVSNADFIRPHSAKTVFTRGFLEYGQDFRRAHRAECPPRPDRRPGAERIFVEWNSEDPDRIRQMKGNVPPRTFRGPFAAEGVKRFWPRAVVSNAGSNRTVQSVILLGIQARQEPERTRAASASEITPTMFSGFPLQTKNRCRSEKIIF